MKYGLFTKSQTESSQQISTIEMPSIDQAEAYFAGRKQLSLVQFHNMFVVKEINLKDSKNLLLG